MPYHRGFGTQMARSSGTTLLMRYGPPDQVGTVLANHWDAFPAPSGVCQSNPWAAATWAGYSDGPKWAYHSASAAPDRSVMFTVRPSALASILSTSSHPVVSAGSQPVHWSARPLFWNQAKRKSSRPIGLPSLHTAPGRRWNSIVCGESATSLGGEEKRSVLHFHVPAGVKSPATGRIPARTWRR